MYPILVGPRVRAIAIEEDRMTIKLMTISMLYQPAFRAMVLVFDILVSVLIQGMKPLSVAHQRIDAHCGTTAAIGHNQTVAAVQTSRCRAAFLSDATDG